MPEFGMKYNGSGCYDETAYKAILNLAKPGEIWQARNGAEDVLILSNHGGFCNCLTMTDKALDKNCVEVLGQHYVMYTNPGMLKFVFNNVLNYRVDIIEPEQLREIKAEVAVRLGLAEFCQQSGDKTLEEKCHLLLDEILKGMKDG